MERIIVEPLSEVKGLVRDMPVPLL